MRTGSWQAPTRSTCTEWFGCFGWKLRRVRDNELHKNQLPYLTRVIPYFLPHWLAIFRQKVCQPLQRISRHLARVWEACDPIVSHKFPIFDLILFVVLLQLAAAPGRAFAPHTARTVTRRGRRGPTGWTFMNRLVNFRYAHSPRIYALCSSSRRRSERRRRINDRWMSAALVQAMHKATLDADCWIKFFQKPKPDQWAKGNGYEILSCCADPMRDADAGGGAA